MVLPRLEFLLAGRFELPRARPRVTGVMAQGPHIPSLFWSPNPPDPSRPAHMSPPMATCDPLHCNLLIPWESQGPQDYLLSARKAGSPIRSWGQGVCVKQLRETGGGEQQKQRQGTQTPLVSLSGHSQPNPEKATHRRTW